MKQSNQWLLPQLKYYSGKKSRLDQLAWPAGISFETYNARIGVRVSDAAIMDLLPHYLPPFSKPLDSPFVLAMHSFKVGNPNSAKESERSHVLYQGSKRHLATQNLNDALDALASVLEFSVALGSPDKLFVHAGVVGWKGKAIIFPGRSMSGKTSLVLAAMLRAGATYYSDEFAVIDSSGLVHPFPRQIRTRVNGIQKRRSLDEFDIKIGSKPLQVGLIALLKYKAGAIWRPKPLSQAEAILQLFKHTVAASFRSQLVFPYLQNVSNSAAVIQTHRDEAESVIPLLTQYLP